MKLLSKIHKAGSDFYKTDSPLLPNFASVRSKSEYASVAWKFVKVTRSYKLEGMQRQYAALCRNRYLQGMQYH
jgi:hypothetical protein